MKRETPDCVHVLDELKASPATIGIQDDRGSVMPALCLHLTVQRHTKGSAMTLQVLPPLYIDHQTAVDLPTALLSAVRKHLPLAWQECVERTKSTLGDSVTPRPGARH